MGLVFTTIQHRFRKHNNLSLNEYVLADMVYKLATSPFSKVKDWCYMSRPVMADELGLSKQTILNLIESLIKNGMIVKDEKTSYIRTTKKWDIVYFSETGGKESLPQGVKKVYRGGKESLPYNNIDNTSLFDNKEEKKDFLFFFLINFNKVRKSKFRASDKLRNTLKTRLSKYTEEEIFTALKNAMKSTVHVENNFNHLTPEFILREDKLEKYLNYNSNETGSNNVYTGPKAPINYKQ